MKTKLMMMIMVKLPSVKDTLQEQNKAIGSKWKSSLQWSKTFSHLHSQMVPYIRATLVVNSTMSFTHDVMNLTVYTSYLSWAPPPTREPAF